MIAGLEKKDDLVGSMAVTALWWGAGFGVLGAIVGSSEGKPRIGMWALAGAVTGAASSLFIEQATKDHKSGGGKSRVGTMTWWSSAAIPPAWPSFTPLAYPYPYPYFRGSRFWPRRRYRRWGRHHRPWSFGRRGSGWGWPGWGWW